MSCFSFFCHTLLVQYMTMEADLVHYACVEIWGGMGSCKIIQGEYQIQVFMLKQIIIILGPLASPFRHNAWCRPGNALLTYPPGHEAYSSFISGRRTPSKS